MQRYDVIIVGGGPAGLSAALGLGRCRRRTVLFDDGIARNDVAPHTHGFFTRDGAPPAELRRIGLEQLTPYGVDVRHAHVEDAEPSHGGFAVTTSQGSFFGRKLVLATGLKDVLPTVEGFDDFYGRSIWHCMHCDGWEARDRPLAVLGHGREGVELALGMRVFSDDVVLLTDGARLDARRRRQVELFGLRWISKRLARFEGSDGALETIVFEDGERLARRGLFFHLGVEQRSPLPERLGCTFDRRRAVKTVNRGEESTVPGLYVVGDASQDARLIVVAAAEGAKAAVHIHRTLRVEDCRLEEERVRREQLAPFATLDAAAPLSP